jgi:hypothetical protein
MATPRGVITGHDCVLATNRSVAVNIPRIRGPITGTILGEPFVTMPVGRGIVSSATIQRMECPGISNAWRLCQSFRADCANRSKLPETLFIEAERLMPKFAIGDVVDKDKTQSGTVIAVFTTIEGEQRYAVDMDGYGALQFVMECNLVPHETPQ